MNRKNRKHNVSPVSLAARAASGAMFESLERRQLFSAGDLDTTFGNGGWAISGDVGTGETTKDVVVQADGKVLEAISEPNNQFAVERLTASGAIDASYGNAGMTTINFGGDPINESIGKLLVLGDGSSIVAGATKTSFVLIHLTASGAIDSNFGTAGLATANVNSDNPAVNDLALQSNGKILVGGTGRGNLALFRFNTNGALDKSFNGTGAVLQNLPGNHEGINALAIQPDGRIVAAGYSTDAGDHEHNTVMRFLSNGTLDTTFNSTGYRSFGPIDMQASGVGLTADGKIVLASTSTLSYTAQIDVYRLNADGSTDTSYGTAGETIISNSTINQKNALVTSGKLAMDANGKAVIAGGITLSSGLQYAVAFRLNTNGTMDTTFGNNGISQFQLYESNMSHSIAIAPDGKIVLSDATAASIGNIAEPGVLRLTTSGALDTAFGIGGRVTNDLTGKLANINDILTLPNGQILAAGWTESPRNGGEDFLVMRFNRDGSIDSTFGVKGMATIDFGGFEDVGESLALQSDDRIIVSGIATIANGDFHQKQQLALVRLNVDGSLDTTFGIGGKAMRNGTEASVVAVMPDDSIIVSTNGVMSNYTKDGVFQPTYLSQNGFDVINRIIPVENGMILVGTAHEVLHLAASDGTRDTSFGVNGIIEHLGGAILNAANGKFLLATESGVSSYLPDGTVDPTFGTNGTTPLPSIANGVQPIEMQYTPDGKIIIGMMVDTNSSNASDRRFGLLRLNADGTIDTTFAGGSISVAAAPAGLSSGGRQAVAMVVSSDGSILEAANTSNGWNIAKFQDDSTVSDPVSDPHVVLSSNGTLTITGTNDPDTISVAILSDSSKVKVLVNGVETDLNAYTVKSISISALDGDDVIHSSFNVPTTVDGGAGDDIITTGNATSVLHGGDGNDTLTGGDAADALFGDAGSDSILGGKGNDYLSGLDGDDFLNGGYGDDTLDGGLGADQLWGSQGNDTADYHFRSENLNISLNDKADDGAAGEMDNVHSDVENVSGGMSSDVITGNKFNNSLVGNGGADTIYGGAGNDTLTGGAGKDQLFGQDGNDVLIAKDGYRDILDGGAGTDSASRDNSSTIADQVLNTESFI